MNRTGWRVAIVTVPTGASSLAICAAESPAPTTTTRCPAYGIGLRYSATCESSLVKVSSPGSLGQKGLENDPLAATMPDAGNTRPSSGEGEERLAVLLD